jgi:hypothetical protein
MAVDGPSTPFGRPAAGRGGLAQDADLDMLVDMAYGVLYYRLLVGHAPLDENAARSLAAELTRSGGSA